MSGCITTEKEDQKQFTIQPKIGGMLGPETGDLKALAIEPLGQPFMAKEGTRFVLYVGDSIVPSPPAAYFYDGNGDGIAETPFTPGDWIVLVMQKSDPLFPACTSVPNGEVCTSKIIGTDSAGNKAEFSFNTTTTYN